MTDQVAPLRALAAPSSSSVTMSGRIALRVGKKIPLMASWTAVSAYKIHMSSARRTERNPRTVTARTRSVAINRLRRL